MITKDIAQGIGDSINGIYHCVIEQFDAKPENSYILERFIPRVVQLKYRCKIFLTDKSTSATSLAVKYHFESGPELRYTWCDIGVYRMIFKLHTGYDATGIVV